MHSGCEGSVKHGFTRNRHHSNLLNRIRRHFLCSRPEHEIALEFQRTPSQTHIQGCVLNGVLEITARVTIRSSLRQTMRNHLMADLV